MEPREFVLLSCIRGCFAAAKRYSGFVVKHPTPTADPAVPMRILGDTAGVPRNEQYSYWVDHVRGDPSLWDTERKDPVAGFRGRAHCALIGGVLLWENHNDPYRVWRKRGRSPEDTGWLYLASSNVEAFASGATRRRFAPNQLVLIDPRHPVELHNSRYARTRYLMIPRSALPEDGAELASALTAIGRTRPLGRMLHGHFRSLFELAWRPGSPTNAPTVMVARQFLELLGAFCETGDPKPAAATPIASIAEARYDDVLNLMAHHCIEADLAPERIAACAGLSRSSLYRLFRSRDTHFSRELRHLRLERARKLLGARGRIYSMTELAMRCGFSNSSVFSRQFRATYGMTPSEYRRGLIRRN